MYDNTVYQRLSWWYCLTFFTSYLSLFLNQTIILDLRQVISNPFVSSEKRVKKYVAVSVLLSLFFCFVNLALSNS